MEVRQSLNSEYAKTLDKSIGVSYLLERRELGAINIGGDGWVDVDGVRYAVRNEEAIYIGKGTQAVAFGSDDPARPAKFYLNCAPAHTAYPTRTISLSEASPQTLGEAAACALAHAAHMGRGMLPSGIHMDQQQWQQA